jgi:hypothetical protein
MSSEGTPIDAIDSGEVPNTADAALMQSILRDMNASGAQVDEGQRQQAPQQMPQYATPPPQYAPQQQQQFMNMPPAMSQMGLPPMPGGQGYNAPPPPHFMMDGGEKRPKKRNIWASILDRIRDPLVVALLVFVLSLPALHTVVGKYAAWAFAVGGQLSWLGLIALSALAGTTFGLYKASSDLLGM